MSKIVKMVDGCTSKKAFYTLPGTTKKEIRQELKELGVVVNVGDVLVKSPLAPRYNNGFDLWKLYAKDYATPDNIEDEYFWSRIEDELIDADEL